MARGQFNPERGDRKIQIGEIEIVLRYTLRSLALMQQELGKEGMQQLLDGGEEMMRDFQLVDRLIHFGMLYHHGEDHGIDVLAEANGSDIEVLFAGFAEAFSAAFAAASPGAVGEDGKAGPTKPAKVSTSTS